ncbi:hypothetical protein FNV43_RR13066 [Rhamnella rubrinervis]|uniref:Uncharacterized protein n=1 Tax=Rhamnella rubrinervis TaxID=2594499 RepID=A0A8K0H0E3_9ROSA|nr:hypothetical protein FNV43_RR13066 [Rhamnella rubrinervis]
MLRKGWTPARSCKDWATTRTGRWFCNHHEMVSGGTGVSTGAYSPMLKSSFLLSGSNKDGLGCGACGTGLTVDKNRRLRPAPPQCSRGMIPATLFFSLTRTFPLPAFSKGSSDLVECNRILCFNNEKEYEIPLNMMHRVLEKGEVAQGKGNGPIASPMTKKRAKVNTNLGPDTPRDKVMAKASIKEWIANHGHFEEQVKIILAQKLEDKLEVIIADQKGLIQAPEDKLKVMTKEVHELRNDYEK